MRGGMLISITVVEFEDSPKSCIQIAPPQKNIEKTHSVPLISEFIPLKIHRSVGTATERPRLTRQLRMWIAHAIGAGSGPDQNVAQSLRLPSGNDQFGE